MSEYFHYGHYIFDVDKAYNIATTKGLHVIKLNPNFVRDYYRKCMGIIDVSNRWKSMPSEAMKIPVLFAVSPVDSSKILLIDGNHRLTKAAKHNKPLYAIFLNQMDSNRILVI